MVVLRNGAIVADGAKGDVLDDALLSEVYETPLRILRQDGHYLVYPGSQ